MIDGITPVARTPRAPQAKSADPATAAAAQAFDLQADQQAEAERERAALEQLMLAQLKDEDDVMKKWIAMIG